MPLPHRRAARHASKGRTTMLNFLRTLAITIGCVTAMTALAADITFYEREGLRGRSFTANSPVQNFEYIGFNDRAQSLVIGSGSWEICSDAYFGGRCVSLAPGDYPSLRSMGLERSVSSARPVGGRIVLFELPNFGGRSITLDSDTVNFDPLGANDRAVSAIVYEGTWQICQHAYYAGGCVTLPPGRHPDLGRLDRQVSSARMVAGGEAGGASVPRPNRARAILFEGPNLTGRTFAIDTEVVTNLAITGFNDRASSLRVEAGYWIFCSDSNFNGDCRTFGPGDYPSLPWDLNNRISSGRRISGHYPYGGNPNWNPR
jgi:hypothetical protein